MCTATRPSAAVPGHTHTCGVPLNEHGGDHHCSDSTCRRWFGVNVRSLVARGAEAGHRVTVTPIGPAWDAECPCGGLSMRRASKRQANEAGLAHLRAVLAERVAS